MTSFATSGYGWILARCGLGAGAWAGAGWGWGWAGAADGATVVAWKTFVSPCREDEATCRHGAMGGMQWAIDTKQ